MQQTVVSKVPFNVATVTKCVCPQCPVQSKSTCVSQKVSKIGEALKQNPLNRKDIPEDYCASGKAFCQDINTKETCICGECPVYVDYKLASGQPAGYFCAQGKAQ